MTAIPVEVPFFAPVPVGHRVTLLGIETRSVGLFGGGPGAWERSPYFLVIDENTRVIYADSMARLHVEATYESLRFLDDTARVSQSQPPLRGQVVSTIALSDHGDSVYVRTVLRIAPDGLQPHV